MSKWNGGQQRSGRGSGAVGRGGLMATAVPVVLAATVILATAAGGSSRAGVEYTGVSHEGGTLVSVSMRPSHNGIYRAAVVVGAESPTAGAKQSWTVEIERADGTPVLDAAIAADAWMPASAERRAGGARAGVNLGGGRYRIDGLDFREPGWWNVPLRITSAAGIDSLAFNVVTPAVGTDSLAFKVVIPAVASNGSTDRAEGGAS